MPLELASPSLNPPYHINLDQTPPAHFRSRLPGSYQAVEAIANRVTSAFVVAVKGVSQNSASTNDHEYLAFAYEYRESAGGDNETMAEPLTFGCLLVVDLRADRVVSSDHLCDFQLTAVTGISFSYAGQVSANYVNARELKFANRMVFFEEEHTVPEVEKNEKKLKKKKGKKNKSLPDSCSSLEQEHCQALYLIDQSSFSRPLPEQWRASLTGPAISSSGYFDVKQQALHVVDNTGTVTQLRRQESSEMVLTSSWPLANFLACNYRPPIAFQLTQTKAIVVLVVGALLQTLICVALYCACKGISQSANMLGDAQGRRKKKRKGKKKGKRRSSSLGSLSSRKSSSRSSLKSKSRKSRKSIGGSSSVSLGGGGGSPSSSVSRRSSRTSGQSISRRSSRMSRKSGGGRRSSLSGLSDISGGRSSVRQSPSRQSQMNSSSTFSRKSSGGVGGTRSSKKSRMSV